MAMSRSSRVGLGPACSTIASGLRPSRGDKAACEKMAEHGYGILDQNTKMSANPTGKKLLAELKQKTVDACTDKWPVSRVECHMKATTTKGMDACDPEE